METIDLYLVAKWGCPNCGESNEDNASLDTGKTVVCRDCGSTFTVGSVYQS